MDKIKTKKISMDIPENLLKAIDEFSISKELTRTNYLLTLARHDLKRRKIYYEKPTVRNGDGFINNRWTGKIEDMPL